MSSDNGVYISRWIGGKGITHYYEYRVAHRQAIENCDYDDNTPIKVIDAYRVLYFGNSEVYTDRTEVLKKATELYDEIMADDFCPVCEYGISFINYDTEFPKISLKKAEKVLDKYWKEWVKKKNG
jgi:hypothetical protein